MNILHISTSDTGGAATAAIRLHEGLLSLGQRSKMLVRSKKNDTTEVYSYQQEAPPRSLMFKAGRQILRTFKPERNINPLSSKKYETFSNAGTKFDITRHPLYQNADVINLHWVAKFLDYPSFFAKNTKPVIWTLHDMNPFQGGFHYRNDLIRNRSNMGAAEEQQLSIKTESLKKVSRLTIVAPSEWLMSESASSSLLGRYAHFHIPYGLNTDLFRPYEQAFARQVFDLPPNRKIFLFISERVENYRKGFDLLSDTLGLSAFPGDPLFVVVGRNSLSLDAANVRMLGPIRDERLMALVLSAADAFILPSREDNFPNVMLEAMACGTPVIGFATGGIPEAVKDNFNGLLAGEMTAASLHNMIRRFLQMPAGFSREAIRSHVIAHYSLNIQAKKYIDLYEQVCHASRTSHIA